MTTRDFVWRGGGFIDGLQQLAGAVCAGNAEAQVRAASAVLDAVPQALSAAEFVTLRAILTNFVLRTAARKGLPPCRLARALRNCESADSRFFRAAVQQSLHDVECDAVHGGEIADPRVALALLYIRSHATSHRVSVDEIAKHVGVSRWHLERLMRRYTGRPMTEHIRDFRMTVATRMLETTVLAVKQIAAETGHVSASAFSRDFRRTFGASPLVWRLSGMRRRAENG
jgi:AraC-like DNA-binding protein